MHKNENLVNFLIRTTDVIGLRQCNGINAGGLVKMCGILLG